MEIRNLEEKKNLLKSIIKKLNLKERSGFLYLDNIFPYYYVKNYLCFLNFKLINNENTFGSRIIKIGNYFN